MCKCGFTYDVRSIAKLKMPDLISEMNQHGLSSHIDGKKKKVDCMKNELVCHFNS